VIVDLQEGAVTLTLKPAPWRILEGDSGRRVSMEGFTPLTVPGSPALPVRRITIALPPGLRARSVQVLDLKTTALPGVFRIEPAPPVLPLPGMPGHADALQRLRREWRERYDAVFASDRAVPESPAWLVGRGALRRYSYATVAYCPFLYHPLSGRLELVEELRLSLRCDPIPGEAPASPPAPLLAADPEAEEKASRLFLNFAQVAPLYAPGGAPAAPPAETWDLVVITAPALTAAIEASGYLAHKAALGHHPRTVLTTDPEIAAQPGNDLAARIRNFLRERYEPWSIRYVLLVGDYLTVPMRICYPDPTIHAYNPDDPGLVAGGTPTDAYYADLSDPDALSWDIDGDGYPGEYGEDFPDFLAEVAVGRIPVNDPGRITYTLDKLTAFEEDAGTWKRNVLQAGAILFFENQNHSGYPFVDGATCLDSIETGLMGGHPVTHMSEQAGLVHSSFPWPALTEAAFTGAWGQGEYGVVNWSGHGWPNGAYRTIWAWDDGDGVPESGNGEMQSQRFIGLQASLLDDDHPSIVFAISCDVGYPEPNPYGNCGIDLLTLPGWGASAGIVSSTRPAAVSGDWKNDPGGTEQICFDFNRCLIVEQERVGDALYDGKFQATSTYGWDLPYEYMNLYNFNLYGDPAMVLEQQPAEASAPPASLPRAIELGPCRPDPFVSSTAVRLRTARPGHVRVTVHDVAGRRVATLWDGPLPPGDVPLTWNASGRGDLPSGVYVIRARTDVEAASRRVVRLRR